MDSIGQIWVGTRGGGLSLIIPDNNRVVRLIPAKPGEPGVPSQDIREVFEDREGRIWVSADDGIFLSDHGKHEFDPISLDVSPSINETFVDNFAQNSAGEIFVRTSNGLLFRITASDSKNRWVGKLVLRTAVAAFGGETDLLIDSHDRLWSSDEPSAIIYDTTLDQWSTTDLMFHQVFEDSGGVIWFAGRPGLLRLDPATLVFGEFLDDSGLRGRHDVDAIFAVIESEDGAIWASGVDGIWRRDPVTRQNTHFVFEQGSGPNPNDTNALYEDVFGDIWGGTYSTGVFPYRSGDRTDVCLSPLPGGPAGGPL